MLWKQSKIWSCAHRAFSQYCGGKQVNRKRAIFRKIISSRFVKNLCVAFTSIQAHSQGNEVGWGKENAWKKAKPEVCSVFIDLCGTGKMNQGKIYGADKNKFLLF